MSANVENMFSVRETPWHGLGRIVMDAPASHEALELAGLDWQVESRNIYSGTGAMIPGYRANVRSTDDAVLGKEPRYVWSGPVRLCRRGFAGRCCTAAGG